MAPTMAPMDSNLQDDLAYVKALAEEGRDTPLVSGVYYALWGGLIGAAALISYAHGLGFMEDARILGYAPFIAAFAIGWIASFAIGRRTGAKPGATTLGNKTASAVWMGVGVFLTAFWCSLFVVHDNFTDAGVPEWFLFNLMFPVSFGVYGVAFYATATAARVGWLRWFALAAWGMTIVTLLLMGSMHQVLAGGIGTLLCAFVPGVLLMRGEPREIV